MALQTSTVLRFGKYKGLTVEAVGKFDASYLLWLKRKGTEFSAEAIEYAKPLWTREYRQRGARQEGWAWGFGSAAKRDAERYGARRIRIEHEERNKAGHIWCCAETYCAKCSGTNWLLPSADVSVVPA